MSRFHFIPPPSFSEYFLEDDEMCNFNPNEWILPYPWISMFIYTHLHPFYEGVDSSKSGDRPKVLQIGCAQGGDAVAIANVLKLPMFNGKLDIIDWFKGNLTVDKSEEWSFNEDNVESWKAHLWDEAKKFKVDDIITVFEGDSRIILPTLTDEYYDIIYIDGGHEYSIIKSDIEHAYKKLKVGGIIVFDDVHNDIYHSWYNKYNLKNAPDYILETDCWTFPDGNRFQAGVLKAVHEFFNNNYILVYGYSKAYHFKNRYDIKVCEH
jgi:hypothetical protein